MNATFKATNPDAVNFTMNITMPLSEWKEVRERLAGVSGAVWMFKEEIGDMITKAEREFYPTGPAEKSSPVKTGNFKRA